MPPPNATPTQLRNRSWWSGPEIYVVVDDYDLLVGTGGNPLAPLLEVLPYSRDVGFASCGGAPHQRCGPGHVRAAACRDARCRLHDVVDERKPRGGLDDRVGAPVAVATRARCADHASRRPAADPGRLDTGAVRSHVIEVGPTAMRRLCCGGATVVDAEMERAAFEASTTRWRLIDLRPVTVASLWRRCLASVDCGTPEQVTVVHPSWWSSARVEVVGAAAQTLVGAGGIRPRSWLLVARRPNRRLTLIVEIAEDFVVVTGAEMAVEAVDRDRLAVAEAVARSVLAMASDTTRRGDRRAGDSAGGRSPGGGNREKNAAAPAAWRRWSWTISG